MEAARRRKTHELDDEHDRNVLPGREVLEGVLNLLHRRLCASSRRETSAASIICVRSVIATRDSHHYSLTGVKAATEFPYSWAGQVV